MSMPRFSRRRWMADVLFAGWVVVWAVVSLLVVDAVSDLRQVSDTLDAGAGALEETAEGLRTVAGIPIVGDDIGDVADEIGATAQQTRQSATESRDVIDRVAVLLGLAVFVAGAVPVAATYVPRRLHRAREARSARLAAVRRQLGDREADEYLATRALVALSFADLQQTSLHPVRDLVDGNYDDLAEAELRRVGIRSS